ncbi:MAG: hypothetical protein QOE70_2011 [Chthoniobacter sp.]|jgi:hypothetical protein|nr:hypothetical protein [Chthoniobacter sp.]
MSIGFKEWTLICDALGRGEQSIILRKGGIAEGRDGFRFKHDEFLLFPTLFHEQVSKLKLPATTRLPAPREDEKVEVRYRVSVEWTRDITDWGIVQRLAPFHLWQEAEIEKRFRQEETPVVSLAFVRVARLSRRFVFPESPKFGGCRSWVELPELPAEITTSPALDDSVHRDRERQITTALGGSLATT